MQGDEITEEIANKIEASPIEIVEVRSPLVDFMMGTHKWHGVAPNDDQLADALSQNPETLGDY